MKAEFQDQIWIYGYYHDITVILPWYYTKLILQSRLGIEFDFYDMEKNVKSLHNLILRKCELKK